MDFLDDANHAPPPPLQIEKIPFSNLEMKKSSKHCTVSTPLMPMLAHIYWNVSCSVHSDFFTSSRCRSGLPGWRDRRDWGEVRWGEVRWLLINMYVGLLAQLVKPVLGTPAGRPRPDCAGHTDVTSSTLSDFPASLQLFSQHKERSSNQNHWLAGILTSWPGLGQI